MHLYHAACLDLWLERNQFCPLCKREALPLLEVIKPREWSIRLPLLSPFARASNGVEDEAGRMNHVIDDDIVDDEVDRESVETDDNSADDFDLISARGAPIEMLVWPIQGREVNIDTYLEMQLLENSIGESTSDTNRYPINHRLGADRFLSAVDANVLDEASNAEDEVDGPVDMPAWKNNSLETTAKFSEDAATSVMVDWEYWGDSPSPLTLRAEQPGISRLSLTNFESSSSPTRESMPKLHRSQDDEAHPAISESGSAQSSGDMVNIRLEQENYASPNMNVGPVDERMNSIPLMYVGPEETSTSGTPYMYIASDETSAPRMYYTSDEWIENSSYEDWEEVPVLPNLSATGLAAQDDDLATAVHESGLLEEALVELAIDDDMEERRRDLERRAQAAREARALQRADNDVFSAVSYQSDNFVSRLQHRKDTLVTHKGKISTHR
jgi:hypothetical protein